MAEKRLRAAGLKAPPPGGDQSPRGPTGGSPAPPLLVVGLALALVIVLAAALALWQARDSPPPGEVVSLVDSQAGDQVPGPGQVPLPRDTQSRSEWEALLPRLQKEAEGNDLAARRRLGLALYNLGRLKETRALYEALLAQDEDPVVRNRLGNVLRDQGDLVGAEKAYRAALKTDPALPAPYLNLAEILWRRRLDSQALAVLEQGRAAVPEGARVVIDRAVKALQTASPSSTTPAATSSS